MKRLILTISFFSCLSSFSQKVMFDMPIDSATNKVSYRQVITNQDSIPENIKTRISNWLALEFPEYSVPIQPNENNIAGKGRFFLDVRNSFGIVYKYEFSLTFLFEIKAGRYRATFTNIYFHSITPNDAALLQNTLGPIEDLRITKGMVKKTMAKMILPMIDEKLRSYFSSLEKPIGPNSTSADDW